MFALHKNRGVEGHRKCADCLDEHGWDFREKAIEFHFFAYSIFSTRRL